MRPSRILRWLLSCAAVCLPVLALTFGQTSGVLRGIVADENGGPLSGVVIAVMHPTQGMVARGAVSDASGWFTVQGLPPSGDYRVRASLPGFASVTLSEVTVTAGQVNEVRIVLSPEAKVRERVEVRARPGVISLEETTTQTTLSSEFVDALPILGRDYQDILTLAPGVTDVDGDGNPNIHGARDTDVITLVDGVSTSDPLTGKIGAQLNIESIQEIQIKTSGAPAEYGRAQGGFADIITKSGGNEFEGSFKFFWRGSALDGDGAGIDDPRLHAGVGESGLRDLRFNDFLPFLSIGGPLLKDRAWFYVANEYIQREDPVNALHSAFLRGVREWREFAKVTWQVNASNRLALSVNYDPQEYLNEGLSGFTREESGYTLQAGGLIVSARSTAVLSPLVVLETSVSFFDQKPALRPNLGADTNGNGTLWTDVNQSGFIDAWERDHGEDLDDDGRFDVFEDTNTNRRLDAGEDLDGDGRLTPYRWGFWGACEGDRREDANCNGHLDFHEDSNNNGVLDEGEDRNDDGLLDPSEDRNHNGVIDDVPVPSSSYPYGERRPVPGDRDYTIDRDTGVTSGPYFEKFSDARKRFTLRQDLSVFVGDFKGSHDLKVGAVFERESFSRRSDVTEVLSPSTPTCGQLGCESPDGGAVTPVGTINVLLPVESRIDGEATGITGGLYLQDNYRPLPNLSLGLGLRFEREIASAFGYSFFNPAIEAAGFERMLQIGGFGEGDVLGGVPADPIFHGAAANPRQATGYITYPLELAALGRLTRHHAAVEFDSDTLRGLGILQPGNGADPADLADLGVNPQRLEKFSITNNNLSPRLSISWDPQANGRTKVFGTWGRYFDKLFLSTIVGEQGPDQINRYYIYDSDGISTMGVPNNHIGSLISKAPPSATQVDRNLRTPFSDEMTLGFEREIAPEVAVSLTFIDRRFRRQLQDVDVNHFLRFDAAGQPLDRFGGFLFVVDTRGIDFTTPHRVNDGRPDLYIHDIFFNQILRVGNTNEARYRGIELALTRRLARRWQMQASYTYSRATGDAEDYQSRLGNDPSTLESEFGYLDYDQRHVVKLNTAIYLPRDWQVGSSLTWGSGLPYSIISRFFAADNLDYEQYRTRYGYTRLEPGEGLRFVQLRRNSERNDAVFDVNLQARKQIVLGRRSAALSLEVFNLLNRDDLRILTYEPMPFMQEGNIHAGTGLNPRGPLQVNGERRFGRRFQVGFRIDF